MRTRLAATLCLLIVPGALALSCKSPPSLDDAGRARADDLLADHRTRDELSDFLGVDRFTCVAATSTTDLCQWSAGNRARGWAPLARTIQTDDAINLICELPRDGSARPSGSCAVYPRRSNRAHWSVKKSGSRKTTRQAEAEKAAGEKMARQARRALDDARTLVELTRLVGAIPDQCTSRSPGLRACLWRATARTYGHGTLAAASGHSARKKLRLRCHLPRAGGERSRESCRIEVGA
jgi:hypothetical protein